MYMPYNSGTASQTQLYTLNQLSAIIEESSGQAPYMVLGDMNTELLNNATLNKNWYKGRRGGRLEEEDKRQRRVEKTIR